MRWKRGAVAILFVAIAAVLALTAVAQYGGSDAALARPHEFVIYSGRSEALVEPLIETFAEETGIKPIVRYGNSAELVALILEEGRRSRADLFWSVDAGSLGALEVEGRLQPLPSSTLDLVDHRLQSKRGQWTATSGRARVIAFHKGVHSEAQLPASIWGFTEPEWRGRIGWAPTNASFQDFITALRVLEGDEEAEQWLRAIQANRPRVYASNSAIVDAIGRNEVEIGFINHYYVHRFRAERGPDFPVAYYHPADDAGAIINTAGVGILDSSDNVDAAHQFVDFLLSPAAQTFVAEQVYEYPVLVGDRVQASFELMPLDEIHAPQLDLTDLKDLAGTLELLERTGVL